MVQRGGKPRLGLKRIPDAEKKRVGTKDEREGRRGQAVRCRRGGKSVSCTSPPASTTESLDIIDNKHLWPGSDPRDLRSVEARF